MVIVLRLRKIKTANINERLLNIAEQKINEKFGENKEEALSVIEQMKSEAQTNGFGEEEYTNLMFFLDQHEEE